MAKEQFQVGIEYAPAFPVRYFRDKQGTWNYTFCIEDHPKGKNWKQFLDGRRTVVEPNKGGVLGDVAKIVKQSVQIGVWVEIREDRKKLPPPQPEPHWSTLPKYQKRKIDKKPWKSNAAVQQGQQAPQRSESNNANTQRESVVLESRREHADGPTQVVPSKPPEHSGRDSQGSGTQAQHQLPRASEAKQEEAVKNPSALVPISWPFKR